MYSIYALVVNFVFGTLAWLFLTRLLLQWVRAPFNNSFVQSLYMVLAPVLRPFEKIIPRYNNFNIALAVMVFLLGQLWAAALTLEFSLSTLLLGVFLILQALYWQLLILLFVFVIASFLQPSPYNELMQVVNALVKPMITPFRRLIPPIGPLDLSVGVLMLSLTVGYQLLALGLQNLMLTLAPAVQ
jgi:YggT family protein